MSDKTNILRGHVSAETAYTVNDYPYGFRLRCKIRYWLEEKKGKGTRFVSQTTNPRAGNGWTNKPKASTYVSGLAFMYLDEKGYVQWQLIGINHEPERFDAFRARFDFNVKELASLGIIETFSRKLNPVSWATYEGRQAHAAGTSRDSNPVAEDAPFGLWGKLGEPRAGWFKGWDLAATTADNS